MIQYFVNQSVNAIELPNLLANISIQAKFFGVALINAPDLLELTLRFALNTVLLFILVHFLYSRNSKNNSFYFSYLSIGVVVFLLSYLLNNVKLELGFALGLFAIFGIIRYRTDAIPIKEMTYLFIVIGISVMNALVSKLVSYAELAFTNVSLLVILWLLEKYISIKQESSIKVLYEKINNIQEQNESELIKDLELRCGKKIIRYEIIRVDFLRDVAEINLYYSPKVKNNN